MTQFYSLQKKSFQALIDGLIAMGFQCVGPQVQNDSIVYRNISEVKQLPWGVADQQTPGEYRLTVGDPQYAFAWVNGAVSIKTFLFKAQETVWKVVRDEQGRLKFEPAVEAEAIALIGVRPCDIAAMLIQDKVFLEGDNIDQRYQARRDKLFTIVMNCTSSSDNCFCIAAGYSPQADKGFDVAMTELKESFLVEAGSRAGVKLIAELKLELATEEERQGAVDRVNVARQAQKRKMPSPSEIVQQGVRDSDHSGWDEVTKQCISCGSCTQVCPTCFCHREMELPLQGENGNEHIRSWDSCFSDDHGYTHGHRFRQGTKEHYQQWLNHKFVYWTSQFDTTGCVGCGRCMSWCPAKIDITQTLEKLYGE